MTTPNLFKFATSELSQDAFICWLLSWADQDYQTGSDKHKALNRLATSMLALFFKKAGNSLPSRIDKIVVKRQVNNIDVLCIINDTYLVGANLWGVPINLYNSACIFYHYRMDKVDFFLFFHALSVIFGQRKAYLYLLYDLLMK